MPLVITEGGIIHHVKLSATSLTPIGILCILDIISLEDPSRVEPVKSVDGLPSHGHSVIRNKANPRNFAVPKAPFVSTSTNPAPSPEFASFFVRRSARCL